MARPTKQGIDYFPLDVQFDSKTELYIAETGAVGLAVLVTLWQIIYQNDGYFILNDDDLPLIIRRRLMLDIPQIDQSISASIRRGVFDRGMAETYGILTSKAIQKRYFDASKKKKSVSAVQNYILDGVSAGENAVYSYVNATNVKVEVNVKEEEEVNVKENADVEELIPAVSPKQKVKKQPPETSETWLAYSDAYANRYGIQPLRNQQTNSQMAKFCKTVPLAEAPFIAAFYVSHNDMFYVKQSHPVGLLLNSAQKLRTEWATGRQVTTTSARQLDQKQSNYDVVQEAIRLDKLEGKI